MERAAWSDARLDDLAQRMDAGFDRLDAKMDAGFARVDADVRELRTELYAELRSLHHLLMRVGGGMIIGLIGVIAAILASA